MTHELSQQERRQVAALTRSLYEGRVAREDFVEALGELADPEVVELIHLLEHEPERGGIHGVTDDEYEAYRRRVTDLIGRLSSYT
jgi:hypothetical protein